MKTVPKMKMTSKDEDEYKDVSKLKMPTKKMIPKMKTTPKIKMTSKDEDE